MNTKSLATRLENDVRELCLPEGRMVGTEGHAVAEAWVSRRLSEIGCIPYRGESLALPYQCDGDHFSNFVGVIPGADRSLAPVLIGAHYDSVIEAPCADDNGAAVAITLAVGEMIARSGGLERDLIVAIFDAEEPPYFQTEGMGSIRFYEDEVDDRGVHFALISDLVGHDVTLPSELLGGFGPMLSAPLAPITFATGVESHPDLPAMLSHLGLPKGLKLISTLNKYVGDMSDHGIFRRNKVPYLFLSCGRWEHYHQESDTPDRLNYRKMAAITDYAESICRAAAAARLPEFVESEDPIEFEAETWRKSLGIMRKPLAKYLGVGGFECREDITKVASLLQSLGL